MWGRRIKPAPRPADVVGRYLVVKSSWRGSYSRILAITPGSVLTQAPEAGQGVTNAYAFAAGGGGADGAFETDIDGLSIGPGPEEFTISARQDRKVCF
jgi:hypothetical protein